MPEANPTALAGSSGLLWAGGAAHLYRIDPDNGAVLRTVAVEVGDYTSPELDPGGQWLWVAQANVGFDPAHPQGPYSTWVLSRRDTLSGAVQAQRRDLPSVIGGIVLPVAGAVWVAVSGGVFFNAYRLDPATLATVSYWGGNTKEPVGSTGAVVAVEGDRLWAFNPGGATLACADARSGTVLASALITGVDPSRLTSLLTAVDTHVFIPGQNGVVVFDQPPACTRS